MFSHQDKLLYIGKASSLKTRVNSYFRGVKNRNKRILEMLAQVWRIETIVCENVLEAELQESYEIRTLKPSYNIILNQSPLSLIFYQRNFESYPTLNDSEFCEGPFRLNNVINDLLQLKKSLLKEPLFFYNESFDASCVREAWVLFAKKQHIPLEILFNANMRLLLTIGYRFLRDFEKVHGKHTFEKWWKTKKEKNLSDELDNIQKSSERIYRLFIRAAACRRDSLQLINLTKQTIIINATREKKRLEEFLPEKFPSIKSESYFLPYRYYEQLVILLNAMRKNKISIVRSCF